MKIIAFLMWVVSVPKRWAILRWIRRERALRAAQRKVLVYEELINNPALRNSDVILFGMLYGRNLHQDVSELKYGHGARPVL